jgi:hypothetical protein
MTIINFKRRKLSMQPWQLLKIDKMIRKMLEWSFCQRDMIETINRTTKTQGSQGYRSINLSI